MFHVGELKVSNCNDSFKKIMEEIRKVTNDESEFERLLTERIVTAFIDGFVESKKAAKENKVQLEFPKNKNDSAAGCIPRKKRSNRKRAEKVSESLIQFIQSLTQEEPVASDVSSSITIRLENEEQEEENRLKKKRKVSCEKIVKRQEQEFELEAEPEMPEKFKRIIKEMNGIKTTFVMQKKLTQTDVAKVNNRLSIPRKQMRNCDFVDEEEMKILDDKKGIMVHLVTPSPSADIVELELKKWKMSSTYTYNLIGAWFKNVVDKEANQLQPGGLVRLWSFRQDSKLCFVLDNQGC
ncbi:B3 domain-containing protein At2g31720-like [Pistacia vera]|uniref:B3 domain-containing protein At2g31720-like n=1 Tax=Pistacia vera TaxID=55513 RepID=UPI00126362D7|nr:B3 domain-containing protein At2g31720-like [Pistacia vera]